MNFISPVEITTDMLVHKPNGIPIVLCSPVPRILKRLNEAGYIALSFNMGISAALLRYPVNDRPSKVLEATQSLLERTEKNILIKDFEMLFDPRYKLDVLKVFSEASKTKNIALIWCGLHSEDRLCYSEPQYSDYHSYEIERYTLICVK